MIASIAAKPVDQIKASSSFPSVRRRRWKLRLCWQFLTFKPSSMSLAPLSALPPHGSSAKEALRITSQLEVDVKIYNSDRLDHRQSTFSLTEMCSRQSSASPAPSSSRHCRPSPPRCPQVRPRRQDSQDLGSTNQRAACDRRSTNERRESLFSCCPLVSESLLSKAERSLSFSLCPHYNWNPHYITALSSFP